MTPLDLAMQLLKDDELPNFCQSCEGAGCKGCDNTGLDVSERFHQEHEPMSVDDMESYYDESHLGHIGRFEANPVEIFQDIIEDTPEGRRKQTNIMGATYRGEPTFNMMPLAGAGRPMVNPHAEIFRRGEPMDIAFQMLKAPYDVFTQEGHAKEPFEGTLYAGGDVTDTPRYYTPSLESALDYAVYGSATGDVPMRDTSPTIRVVQDPGFNEKGQPAGRLIADPKLRDAYMQYDDSPLQSELMDDDTLRQLISQMSDKSPKHDTTGYYHSQQDRERHIEGALQRLRDKKGDRLDLTDSEKRIGGISTGRHDELDMMDFDDINSGWDFLEDWEKSWLLDNRFDELPMWLQEEHQDEVKTGEPMDLAMRLLKSPLDLLSADELFELSALGTDDPELVERHLGEYRTLTPEEAEDISFRAVDAQITEGDASHPEGMSHEENVKQFRGRGGRPVNWGFNVGTRFGRGDEEGETHWEKSPPTIGPPPVNEPIFIPPGPKSPEIIANLAWPMGFTTENKGEPMDIAFQMLKAPYLPESFRPTQQGAQGVFAHPEMPQVQYRMSITYMGKDPYVEVEHPDTGETIAYSMFQYEPHPYDKKEPGYFVSGDTWVHEDHRGKGMGPAMYDFLVSQIGQKPQGLEVRPSESLLPPGEKMWETYQGAAESHRTPWISTV